MRMCGEKVTGWLCSNSALLHACSAISLLATQKEGLVDCRWDGQLGLFPARADWCLQGQLMNQDFMQDFLKGGGGGGGGPSYAPTHPLDSAYYQCFDSKYMMLPELRLC